MSTILKALRRLEEDNAGHAQRSLREEVMAAGQAAPRRPGRRWIGVVAALLAVAFVSGSAGVWFALRDQAAPISMATGEIPVRRSGATAGLSASARPPARSTPNAATGDLAGAVASLDASGIAATAPTPEVSPLPSVAAPPPRRSPLEDLAMVARPAPVALAPVSAAPTRLPLASAESDPRRSTRIRVETPEPAPDPTVQRNAVSEIPVVVHAQIPELVVRATRWHPSPDRRVVELELPAEGRNLTLHEGDVVGPLVVGEITLSGVVLRHGDVEIQGRVGEVVSPQ